MKIVSTLWTLCSAWLLASAFSSRVHMDLTRINWSDGWVYIHLLAAYLAVGAIIALSALIILAVAAAADEKAGR